jgi:hypothetical protein
VGGRLRQNGTVRFREGIPGKLVKVFQREQQFSRLRGIAHKAGYSAALEMRNSKPASLQAKRFAAGREFSKESVKKARKSGHFTLTRTPAQR